MGNYGNLNLFSIMSLSLYNSVLLAFCIIISTLSRETFNLKYTFDYTYCLKYKQFLKYRMHACLYIIVCRTLKQLEPAVEYRRSAWCSLVSNLMSEDLFGRTSFVERCQVNLCFTDIQYTEKSTF